MSTKKIFTVALRQGSSRFVLYSCSVAGLSKLFVFVSVSVSVSVRPSLPRLCLSLWLLLSLLPLYLSPSLSPPSLPSSLPLGRLPLTSPPPHSSSRWAPSRWGILLMPQSREH